MNDDYILDERAEWCKLLHDRGIFDGLNHGFCYAHNKDINYLYELSAVW